MLAQYLMEIQFFQKKVEYYGQPIFAVAATSVELARKAGS